MWKRLSGEFLSSSEVAKQRASSFLRKVADKFEDITDTIKTFSAELKEQYEEASSIQDIPKIFANAIDETKKLRDFDRAIEFSPTKTSHIVLTDSPKTNPADRGKFFVRETPTTPGKSSVLREATEEEISKANTLAIGGIDFDTPMHISALLKAAGTISSKHTKAKGILSQCFPLAVYPEVSRQDRYNAAVQYTLNKHYYPYYIQKRTEKFILPKIIHPEDSSKIVNPERPISLFSFSVGGREVMMMENALRDILKIDFKQNEEDVSNLFGSFGALSLGYAAHMQPIDPCFTKVIAFATVDTGVLRPKDTQRKLLLSPKIYEEGFVLVELNSSHEYKTFILILGPEILPIYLDGKDGLKDHSLPHYVAALQKLPEELQEKIGDILCTRTSDIEEAEPKIVEIVGETNEPSS